MKSIFLALLLCSSTAFAFEKVQINGKLYVAQGFDDNDLVEITVVGTLPDSCHRNPTFDIKRIGNHQHVIRLYAHLVPNPEGCRQISMAYQETINFGMMYEGEHSVSLANKNSIEKKRLTINPASTYLVDEFLYGNVNGVVENDSNRQIELIGMNPVNCLVFEKIDTEIQDSMIILRPQFKEVGVCKNKNTPFKIKYEVPRLQNSSKGVLLHVRVMSGRSYNYLFQNKL
jgi:hypothetical protein